MNDTRPRCPGSVAGRPAAFFDRDGVLNVDHGYVHDPRQLDLIDGAVEAVRLCNAAGYLVLVVTNQSGVARGLFDEASVRRFHRALQERFARAGATIDDIRYCPHHPDAGSSAHTGDCDCRKPRPGMLLDLARAWSIDMTRSFLIGDKPSDIAAAAAADIPGLLYEGNDLPGLVQTGLVQTGLAGHARRSLATPLGRRSL